MLNLKSRWRKTRPVKTFLYQKWIEMVNVYLFIVFLADAVRISWPFYILYKLLLRQGDCVLILYEHPVTDG